MFKKVPIIGNHIAIYYTCTQFVLMLALQLPVHHYRNNNSGMQGHEAQGRSSILFITCPWKDPKKRSLNVIQQEAMGTANWYCLQLKIKVGQVVTVIPDYKSLQHKLLNPDMLVAIYKLEKLMKFKLVVQI